MNYNSRIAQTLIGKKPLGYEQLSVDGNAVYSLTPTAYTDPLDKPYYAIVIVKAAVASSGNNHVIRFREDGTNPTAAIGMTLGDAWVYELVGFEQISKFRMISADSDPAVIHEANITYYKLGDQ